MKIDSTYKAIAIEPEDTEEARYCKILAHVSSYLVVAGNTLMSAETQKKILGNDRYMKLALDAICYLMNSHSPEELELYVESKLPKSMIFRTKNSP